MQWDNRKILQIAMEQSAADLSCNATDFISGQNRVVTSKSSGQARKYLELPFFCDLVTYGSNVVASVDMRVAEFVASYINRFSPERCFETPQLHLLEREFAKYGKTVCFMAEYFLPDVTKLRELPCRYEVRVLEPREFAGLYLPEWSNALCEKRKQLDMLAVGAFEGSRPVGLAGCSADCDTMWQIGIDVLPAYRRQGVAAALTSRLAKETFARGRVPFYCAAWSNIKSVRNAIKSGFYPAWAELTAVREEKAEELLK